jgi:alkylation response protein AidB-like acyl-CoA dehydrogenase
MNLLPDAEQTQLLDAAIDFLRKEAPVRGGETIDSVRARMGRSFWAQIGGLGWIGLGLEADHGGVGYSLAEEVLFFREFGRHLLSPAILGGVLGARAAATAGETELAGAIVAGEAVVGLAFGDLAGGERYLLEADAADYVLACGPDEAILAPVAAFTGVASLECFDDRLQLSKGRLTGSPAARLSGDAAENLFLRGVALSAAMLAGAAEASRDVSVDYAKTRRQFGTAIGAFQAVKHKCADMAVRCEGATSMAFYAALAVRDRAPGAALDASAAKAFTAEAAIENASASVQVHGGMGYTEQMTPHLYVKRARVLDQLFQDRRWHLARLLELPMAAA